MQAASEQATHHEAAAHDEFARQGYVMIQSLIDRATADFLWSYLRARVNTGTLVDDDQVPGAPAAYADPALENLLEWIRPRIERIVGLELHPTYSYCRLYRAGDSLKRHLDRPACEISVSVSLGAEPAATWPLMLRGRHGAGSAALKPGDGLLYRGTEVEHWREPFNGERLGQVFLHYVDKHGKHSEWKFDKRASLRFHF